MFAPQAAPVLPSLPTPYLLFLGEATELGYVKTALGLRDWATGKCVGEFALPAASVTTGLLPMTPEQAAAAGARSMVIGVANVGGFIPDSWISALSRALAAGLDLVSGLHVPLDAISPLRKLANQHGRRLIDVRKPPQGLPVGTGQRRKGKRILTVGTDCALGKKYTALALARALRERGVDADFRATGQTGIMIAGDGLPLDAVVSDFAAGAAEILSPDAGSDHWDVIEGQGSLLHPAYAGVSLSLLHGSQPDVFVVCDEPGRQHMLGLPDYPVPSIERIVELTIALGALTNANIRCGGVSVNTAAMDDEAARDVLMQVSDRIGLPAADPIRQGQAFDRLVESCLAAGRTE